MLIIFPVPHKQYMKNPIYRLCLCLSEQCDLSLWLLYMCFFSDPMNGRILQNVEKYEKLLFAASPPRGNGLRRPTSNHLRTRDTYERLCQTQGSQVFITMNHSGHMCYMGGIRDKLIQQPEYSKIMGNGIVLFQRHIYSLSCIQLYPKVWALRVKFCISLWKEEKHNPNANGLLPCTNKSNFQLFICHCTAESV